MAFETQSLDRINRQFTEMGAKTPSMWWEYGTLWIDNPTEGDLQVIKDAMVEDILAPEYTVQFNCLKATKTEPWDQWAMDIVEKAA
jgi:hypothetical protein